MHGNRDEAAGSSGRKLINQEDYRLVEDGFRSAFPVGAYIEWHLRGVMTDTLSHPGSLTRSQLAFSLLRSLGFDEPTALNIGTAIEYYHTASLLFDDLPCMDNADKRRGHLCPHLIHGESSAILGALALINQAYAMLWRDLNRLPEHSRMAAGNLVNECLGLNGILNGQSHDLHFADSRRGAADVLRIARGKTVTLIRLTLLLPAHMGGMIGMELQSLEQLSISWGLAYQILDDFKDCLMNSTDIGKTTARDQKLAHPNLPLAMGADEALSMLNRQLDDSRGAIRLFGTFRTEPPSFHKLQSLLESERDRMVALLNAPNNRLSNAVL